MACLYASLGGTGEMLCSAGQVIVSRYSAKHFHASSEVNVLLRKLSFARIPFVFLLIVFSALILAHAQSDSEQVGPILGEEILSPQVATFELKEYILRHVAHPPSASSAEQWTSEAKRLREHLLNDIAFHGWPKEWVNSPPKFEDLGVFATEKGYRLRKLRYEIVPGFQSTAILYEPEEMQGKIPAILNVNGHVGAMGKAVEYKQKRCITFAKHGILALNLDWLGMGELRQKENEHWFGAHLDLVGVHELGLFYLAMRRGLDYLNEHPHVDRSRLGVTGLSGGGWQTLVLSSLDERVTAAVPVAGFSSIRQKIEARWYGDLGDVEQSPADGFQGADYPDLVALRAPRPTLLIHNAEDDCCFRAPLVKPLNYDAIKPIFRLFGKEDALGWHENTDPSTHNYQLDNRTQAYHFFSQAFNLPAFDEDLSVGSELKSYDELAVGLPKDNLTILGLAKRMAAEVKRAPIPSDASARGTWTSAEREKLRQVVRLEPVKIARAWAVAITKNKGVESFSYLFRMENGLSANGVWVEAIQGPPSSSATIVLDDRGKKRAGDAVADRVNRGERVLALDLIFTGDAWPLESKDPSPEWVKPAQYEQILHSLGERPLGMEAAQLIEIARWVRTRAGVEKVRLECTGIRNQVAGLVAAALEPQLFSEIVVHEGMKSLGLLLAKPVEFLDAPELFCLDLYKEFDLDRLEAVAAPTKVKTERYLEDAAKQ
jgi:dienelactone hydrolase